MIIVGGTSWVLSPQKKPCLPLSFFISESFTSASVFVKCVPFVSCVSSCLASVICEWVLYVLFYLFTRSLWVPWLLQEVSPRRDNLSSHVLNIIVTSLWSESRCVCQSESRSFQRNTFQMKMFRSSRTFYVWHKLSWIQIVTPNSFLLNSYFVFGPGVKYITLQV